ncbi:MAG: fatty-acyl-CoA synthase [Polaribacter sp.]|jgi:fatty-acyl-CoA synthase
MPLSKSVLHDGRTNNVTNPYNTDLDRNPANFQPLTPLTFLERAASVFPKQVAIIHGQQRLNYEGFYRRSRQLASSLAKQGIGRGDTVSAMLANTPAMLEAHYGVPMCGGVLHSINSRLDPKVIALQLEHAEAKVLIVDREFVDTIEAALALTSANPLIIEYNDVEYPQLSGITNAIDYEHFVSQGDADFKWLMPEDEWDAISVSYTSGTTGDPKGVVYHHRGAYLLAQGNALTASMPKHSVYLWTLPMFHCNGWCFPWTMSAISGTHVCLRWVKSKAMWDALADHHVTHLCGAPVVMSTLLSAELADKRELDHVVDFFTAAAPPPERILADMKLAGFNVTHLYGLTETYGPAVVNDWHAEWDGLDSAAQASLKARQGVRYLPLEGLDIFDANDMTPVPNDGVTIGEIMFRGNVVMKGYLKNKKASDEAFSGGWFHSGDLGVMYPDGYIQIKDRSKDIIISGGENISSIEIENVLYQHPAVSVAAVVAMPSEKWGETPCAFVEFRPDQIVTEAELRQWCKNGLASFKVPSKFIFTDIPKTSTGKIQKFALRNKLKSSAE